MNTLQLQTRNPELGTCRKQPFRGGFTLMEVMFAVMILGVGLIAAGSLFPVAGAMQRDTFDQVTGRQLSLSASAMVQSIELMEEPSWDKPPTTATSSKPFSAFNDGDGPNGNFDTNGTNYKDYRLVDRSWPTVDLNFDGLVDGRDVPLRTLFWEPICRWDNVGMRWQTFLVIFRRVGEDVSDVIDPNGPQLASFLVPAAVTEAGLGQQVITDKGFVEAVKSSANPVVGWVGRSPRVDPVAYGRSNMEIVQVIGMTGVVQP